MTFKDKQESKSLPLIVTVPGLAYGVGVASILNALQSIKLAISTPRPGLRNGNRQAEADRSTQTQYG